MQITCDRISKLLKFHNTTMAKMCEDLGIGINTISGWKEQSPLTSTLLLISKYLNASTDYLLGLTDQVNQYSKPYDVSELTLDLFAYIKDLHLSDKQIQIIYNGITDMKRFDKV